MIRIEHVCKTFKLYDSPFDRLKEILLGRKYHREFEALKDISFEVRSGETLGIIGQNGAGKSTLLKILTGVLLPDRGEIHIDGKITGILELGTGFNSEMSGMQNIFMNGMLLGMSKPQIQEKLDRIVAFSELGDFIHEPLKTYSSGMVMRLAFSIAIHADPEVFVVDEALSVGDAYFQQKCMNRIREFKEQGGAIVFVSHDMNAVKVLCQRAVLLDHGRTIEEGVPEQVINTYNFLLARKARGEEIRFCDASRQTESYGNFKIEIAAVKMLDCRSEESEIFISGKPCGIEIALKAKDRVEQVTVGILIRDRFGQDIFGTNTFHMNIPIELKPGEEILVKYQIDEFNLGPGKYTLTVAAHRDDQHLHECFQWVDKIRSFEVVGGQDFAFIGLSRLKPRVRLETHTPIGTI